jgi:6-pyruvoyltetrahydropterin/6-carboxytetrahydropterin synthase
MITCTRRIEFDAGHRVMNHESKCKMLHGHRYAVEATFEVNHLDELGRVIDFGTIKDVLGKWIDDNLDHNVILHEADAELGSNIAVITKQKIYYLKNNPTAENIALHLLNDICPQLFASYQAKCAKIRVFETPNCYSESYGK